MGEQTRGILFLSVAVSLFLTAIIFTLTLHSNMDDAADERRNYHSVEDLRIQPTGELPDPELVSGSYVYALIDDLKSSMEGRRLKEYYNLKINGLDASDASIEMNSHYSMTYHRDSAGALKQISFWKEASSP